MWFHPVGKRPMDVSLTGAVVFNSKGDSEFAVLVYAHRPRGTKQLVPQFKGPSAPGDPQRLRSVPQVRPDGVFVNQRFPVPRTGSSIGQINTPNQSYVAEKTH